MNPFGVDNGPIETREIRPRERYEDPQATTEYNGDWYSAEEVAELKRRFEVRQAAYRQELRQGWEQSEQGKLCLAFYEAFQAYKRFLETHPFAEKVPNGPYLYAAKYTEHDLFTEGVRLAEQCRREQEEIRRRNLEKAQRAARCQHVFTSGEQCGSPRMRGKKLCYMHERLEEEKTTTFDLGPMEDAESIQLGIKRLQRAIIEGKLELRQIGLLAYTIQLASCNVSRVRTE